MRRPLGIERVGAREIQPKWGRLDARGTRGKHQTSRERRFAKIGGGVVRAAIGIGRERTVCLVTTGADEISEKFTFAFAGEAEDEVGTIRGGKRD